MPKPSFKRLDHLRKNDFVRHNVIYFAGSMVVAIVNYLYYPIVGRLVSTSNFGEVQAIVSLFLQMVLLLGVVTDVTVNIVANSTDQKATNDLVYELERLVSIVMVVFVMIGLAFINQIKHFLHFTDTLPLIILGILLVLSALASQRSAYLRGKNAFGRVSISSFITASVKLVGSLILVLIGFGTSGAVGGLVLAQLASLVYLVSATKKAGLKPSKTDSWLRLPNMQLIKPYLPFALLVFIVSIVTTVFFSIDVVLSKHFFSAQVAGEYAGIATIGRIIYFLTGSVATVLLSAVHLHSTPKQNRALFLRSLLLTSVLGGIALVAFAIAPRFFIHLLIGKRYLPLAYLLPRLSITLFTISIVNLIFSYDVALRRWSIAIISVIGTIATTVLVSMYHNSPVALVNALLAGAVILLVIRLLDSFRRNVLHFGPDAYPKN
jgi:O-antigen/teichoic acid export membrane protein